MKHFTNLYPLSKTIRFELIPKGRTLEHIEKNSFIKNDKHRAKSYLLVKKIIDEYHKQFIACSLEDLKLTSLDEYYLYYLISKKNDNEIKKFKQINERLRKEVANKFTNSNRFKNLFVKELIKEDLIAFVQSDEDKKLIEEFQNFTTYFTGFHENRKNIYSDEEISTAIAFRLIHQNLPRFIDNMRTFEKILLTPVKSQFTLLLKDLGEILQVMTIEEMFSLKYFNETLTQQGIDVYNHLLGGYSDENNIKIKGLNEYINLYNQTASKDQRIGKLKPLFKQILSDRDTASFIPDEFTKDNEVLESIEKFYQEINVYSVPQLKKALQGMREYDIYKIYLKNDGCLTDISQKIFNEWSVIQKALYKWFEQNYKGKNRIGSDKYEEEKKKHFSSQESYSIGFINDCLLLMDNTDYHLKIEDYYSRLGAKADCSANAENIFSQIELNYTKIYELLNTPYSKENLAHDQQQVDKIKLFLDKLKELQYFVKPLLGKGDEADKDERFYGEFTQHWHTLNQLTFLYNKVRNYMTRKPYSTEKIKLNFENPTLLNGWDVNKEADNTGVILRKNDYYYLAIIDKKNNKILKNKFNVSDDNLFFEKMEYKLLPGANKMLPKVFFSNSRIEEFNPSETLLKKYKKGTHKKGNNFNLNDCHALIDFFKHSINKHEDWKQFGFQFSETNTYQDLSGFYREVEQQGYKLSFRSIPEKYIQKMVDEGKLYLFQIYNKDFSSYSKGKPNLHTLYWNMLFDSKNLKNVVYKLNGQAEIFFRKSSIKEENRIIHKANASINNKNNLNKKKQSNFNYDIIKNKRYTVDKFQFHVPITMNFKATDLKNINNEVNTCLKKSDNIHIIGIDRGERHLLYLTLIDLNGHIIKQISLNEIVNEYDGNFYKTNYHYLLDKKEDERDEARKNWKTIENIKELKEGYISQVIHKISKLMVEYNAIVVLEDLNNGFMRGRQKVEKQVYQKFEKMLIDKLNFLVDKNKSIDEIGGALRAYQLTNKFESFQKVGKQSGFLFYIPAWNTSKMDPVTGFVNLLDTRYENMDKAKAFLNRFDSIRYNKSKDYFEFEFDYNRFTSKSEGARTHWTICTNDERIETFRNPQKNNQWDNRVIVLTDAFKKLFSTYGIDYNRTENLKDSITKQTEKGFYQNDNKNGLLQLLKLTLQMRNSITGTEEDYLISPVANDNGEFFDSRKANDNLPKNADANGAYNIARKGLWVINQIKQSTDINKIKLAISNKEWLDFAQKFSK